MTGQETLVGARGAYRLIERIGAGGTGVVHLALDSEGRTVAVKELHPAIVGDPATRHRLEREIAAMRRVRSRHVAELVDAVAVGDRPFIATRYVPGRTLQDTVRVHGPLAGADLARVASGTAAALVAIHGAGIVHRDLKPGNVVLAGGEPVVIDFGIAHAIDATRVTETGTIVGTPGYLAPEVINGAPADRAADIFSWGATLAFAATGRPPFGVGPVQALFLRISAGQADLRGVPEPLLAVVRAALSLDPAARPAADRLLRWLAEAAPAAPAGSVPIEPAVNWYVPTEPAVPAWSGPKLPVTAVLRTEDRAREQAGGGATAGGRRPEGVPAPLSRRWAGLGAAAAAGLTVVVPVVGMVAVVLVIAGLRAAEGARQARHEVGPVAGAARALVASVAALAAIGAAFGAVARLLCLLARAQAASGFWGFVLNRSGAALAAWLCALAVLAACALLGRPVLRVLGTVLGTGRPEHRPVRQVLAVLGVLLVASALLVPRPVWWPLRVDTGRTLHDRLLGG